MILAVFSILFFLISLFSQQHNLYPADSVAFYQQGTHKFEALFSDMEQAQHHIHAEYFIFANDSLGSAFISLLARKAAQGVECRLIIDGYYDVKRHYNYASRLDSLRALGIQVYLYDPYRFPYVNHNMRDHRKIVVIDGRVGYTGGFNVADYNVKGRPESYGDYLDTHVRLAGPAVMGLQQLFSDHFTHVSGLYFSGAAYYPYGDHPLDPTDSQPMVAVVQRSRHLPGKKAEMRRAVRAIIEHTHDSLHILTPYLLPTWRIRRALKQAIRRGVHIELIFSQEGDTPMFDAANLVYSRRLQRQGAEIWLCQGAFQHSKVIMSDGRISMVGSVNLDSRALRWNEEDAVIIFDSLSTSRLDSSFIQSQATATPLTSTTYRSTSVGRRLYGHFINYCLSWCL